MVKKEADNNYTAEVLNDYRISPPPASVPPTNLPVTFFDMLWILCPPMRRLFFFDFPYSTHHFMNSILPSLKHSLSLSLQHFFPLSGNLIFPPHPHKPPHFVFSNDDFISLTISESCDSDFKHLIANYPRDAKDFYPFVPDLPNPHVLPDGSRVVPLMALQITIFPNQGLCISIAFHHVVADGTGILHFIKSWASFHRNHGEFLDGPLPYLDRTIIKYLDLESFFSQKLFASGGASSFFPISDISIKDLAPVNKVRATLILSKTQIEKLKNWVSTTQSTNNEESEPLRLSAFIVTCSLIWWCLIQSREKETNDNSESDKDEFCYLVFVADCRNRLKDVIIPSTYFGNCLDMCVVKKKRSELSKHNFDIVAVAEAIGNRIREFEREPLKKAEKWFEDWKRCAESGQLITIAGSPKMKVYDADFGWGRPSKSEVLHVDSSMAVSMEESIDDKGGIELGLGFSRDHMNCFIAIWEENLKLFCC